MAASIGWGIVGPGGIAGRFANSLTMIEGGELRAEKALRALLARAGRQELDDF